MTKIDAATLPHFSEHPIDIGRPTCSSDFIVSLQVHFNGTIVSAGLRLFQEGCTFGF